LIRGLNTFESTDGFPKVTGLFGAYDIFVFNAAPGGGGDINNS
jgi:hypothetical protein